jgi:hypothetical protein
MARRSAEEIEREQRALRKHAAWQARQIERFNTDPEAMVKRIIELEDRIARLERRY